MLIKKKRQIFVTELKPKSIYDVRFKFIMKKKLIMPQGCLNVKVVCSVTIWVNLFIFSPVAQCVFFLDEL